MLNFLDLYGRILKAIKLPQKEFSYPRLLFLNWQLLTRVITHVKVFFLKKYQSIILRIGKYL